MNSQQALRLHIAILLAQHGKESLLHAVADTLETSQHELVASITELKKSKLKVKQHSSSNSQQNLIESVAALDPNKAVLLNTLISRFQNKTFLPELRQVRHFLESRSRSPVSVTSRASALSKVLKILADMDSATLQELYEQPTESYSSLGIISDQILNRRP